MPIEGKKPGKREPKKKPKGTEERRPVREKTPCGFSIKNGEDYYCSCPVCEQYRRENPPTEDQPDPVLEKWRDQETPEFKEEEE